MIAYEIQLRYVIRDKIQSETKSSLRQNSVRDKKICFGLNFVSDFQAQSELSMVYLLSSLSSIYIPQ